MFRFACLCAFALVSTNAFACEKYDWQCDIIEGVRDKEARDRAFDERWDRTMQAAREYDQRDRLSADEDRRQSLIQGQLNQLNMNTIPRY